MKIRLMALAVALFSVPVMQPVLAQSQTRDAGFFGSLTGGYFLEPTGGDRIQFTPGSTALRPGDGWAGRVFGGYRFANGWDVAARFSYLDLSNGDQGFASGPSLPYHVRGHALVGDGELGYSITDLARGLALRPFVGARVARFTHRLSLGAGFAADMDFTGIGPRVGVDGIWRFASESRFSLVGEISAALLFGNVKDSGQGSGGLVSKRDSRHVVNFEAKLGLAWDIAPQWTLVGGYQIERWSDVANRVHLNNGGNTIVGGNADRLLHGPFLRVAYNLGAAQAVARYIPYGHPSPSSSYYVFFDSGRSDLTEKAKNTIRQASDLAKNQNNVRVDVAGHTDTSGSEQFNMALSLRRASVVKEELERNGIPALSIMVSGYGEVRPLAPTGNGVNEPQNRRVEIIVGRN